MKRMIAYLTLAAMLMSGLHGTAEAQELGFPWGVAAVRLDWNPNEDLIAISDAGSVVTILDAQTRMVLNTLPVMPFPVSALRWSDDGTRLAVGGEYSIQVWDNAWNGGQATLSLALQVPPERNGLDRIDAIDWNDAAQQILTTVLRHVYIWDSQTGQLVRTIEPFTTPIVSAAWSPDGTRLAHANVTGYVLIESLTTNESGGADAYERDAPWAMAWEPNGNNLIVGTSGGILQAFDFSPRRLGSDVVALRDDYVPIFSIDWHPTMHLVAVGYGDGIVEIWNPYTYDLIQRVQEHTGAPVMSVSWSPDGTQLAYADGAELIIAPAPTLELPTPAPYDHLPGNGSAGRLQPGGWQSGRGLVRHDGQLWQGTSAHPALKQTGGPVVACLRQICDCGQYRTRLEPLSPSENTLEFTFTIAFPQGRKLKHLSTGLAVR